VTITGEALLSVTPDTVMSYVHPHVADTVTFNVWAIVEVAEIASSPTAIAETAAILLNMGTALSWLA